MAIGGGDLPPGLGELDSAYELIRELGRGGMAVVYLARERASSRLVAIKAIHRQHVENPEALARFEREARMVADLDQPNIVRTYGIEQIGEKTLAIVMQYVPGRTLRQALREDGAFSFERATSVLRDVGEALRYAHARGLVHRDVKPENIFLDETTGRALLSDFGIARSIEGDQPLTLQTEAIGTPAYMSPEQIEGRPLDGRSDLYSLGVVGWEMLAGMRPWEGENLYSVIYKQRHEELPRLTALRPDIPEPLLFAIEGALHKDRRTRWANADEFLTQLLEEVRPPTPAMYPPPRLVEDSPTVRFRRPDEPAITTPAQHAYREHVGAPVVLWKGVAVLAAVLLIVAAAFALGHGRARRSGATHLLLPDSAATHRPLRGRRDSSAAAAGSTAGGVAPIDSPPPGPGYRPSAAAPRPTRRTVSRAAPATGTTGQTAGPARMSAGDVAQCQLTGTANQRSCVMVLLNEGDADLNRAYVALVAALRRQGGMTAAGQPEPESVQHLRAEQRRWLADRDQACAQRGRGREGALWGPVRARCLIDFADRRAAELNARREQIAP